jgi:threonine dehydrogenase-like Zn-dependent dehydrogenase
MRQLTFVKAGQRLEWRDVPEPRRQGPAEAIVRRVAVASCDLDQALVRGQTPWTGPFALGHEFVAEVPLEMYTVGVTFKTGRVMARATIPKVLELVEGGRLNPDLVTSDRASSDEADQALPSYRTKLVATR